MLAVCATGAFSQETVADFDHQEQDLFATCIMLQVLLTLSYNIAAHARCIQQRGQCCTLYELQSDRHSCLPVMQWLPWSSTVCQTCNDQSPPICDCWLCSRICNHGSSTCCDVIVMLVVPTHICLNDSDLTASVLGVRQ